ncbi:MAG: PspA/IM30 family protein [Gemmatimonadota bacterium]|nr:PspA/IM30 family protein [Gemmatimonadota bacterium]
MFKKLKEAIDAALSSLESRSGQDAEDIDRLLSGMREELIEAKAATPKLEDGLAKLRRREADERSRAEDCVRRAGQAEEIGDPETLRVAVEFAERHQERARVLGEQVRAAEAELALHRKNVKEMSAQLKSAIAQKDALKAQGRRSRATEALRGGGYTAADRFDRMAADIEDESYRAEAARDLDEDLEYGATGRGRARDRIDPDDLADLQLEELKRRMADEGGEAS